MLFKSLEYIAAAAGDIPILPMTGNLPAGNPSGVTTSFTNASEQAQAGFYSAISNMPPRKTRNQSFGAPVKRMPICTTPKMRAPRQAPITEP